MRQRPIRSTGRKATRGLALLALVPTFGLVLATAAYADVTAVSGSAFGERVTVTTLLGSVVNSGPTPTVTLPGAGSATPVTASTATVSTLVLNTGVLNVSTQGTPGPSGSVTSSAEVTNPSVGLAVLNVLTASAVRSSCVSNEAGSTGTTTIAGLNLLGVATTVATAPNTTVNVAGVGILHVNEQIVTGSAPSSGITVNALRLEINAGPLGNGNIIIGQSVCGVTGTGVVVPTGAIGGVLLTAIVAVAFGVYQFRRGRRTRGASAA
jgi:hypothetical protein